MSPCGRLCITQQIAELSDGVCRCVARSFVRRTQPVVSCIPARMKSRERGPRENTRQHSVCSKSLQSTASERERTCWDDVKQAQPIFFVLAVNSLPFREEEVDGCRLASRMGQSQPARARADRPSRSASRTAAVAAVAAVAVGALALAACMYAGGGLRPAAVLAAPAPLVIDSDAVEADSVEEAAKRGASAAGLENPRVVGAVECGGGAAVKASTLVPPAARRCQGWSPARRASRE